MKLWSRGCVLVGCAMLAAGSLAQQWKAEVPAVEKAGVYRMDLSPQLVGFSQQELSDVRLIDQRGKEVPFMHDLSKDGLAGGEVVELAIVRNERSAKATEIQIDRPKDAVLLDNLHLRVRNAQVQKEVVVEGSDDGSNWYFVKKDAMSLDATDGRGVVTLRAFGLPATDYRHYRLLFNDSTSSPVQVTGAYWMKATEHRGRFVADETVVWAKDDSLGDTWIHVRADHQLLIDSINFIVQEPERYSRGVTVRRWETRPVGRGSKRRYVRELERQGAFDITSGTRGGVRLPSYRLDTFEMTINNGDDQPLVITGIRFLQLQRSLLAELKPGQRYTITTGDPKKRAPQYDLAHFKDQLPAPIATLNHGPLIAIPSAAHDGPAVQPSRWWIWAGLVAVLGLVGFMAVRMLRETPSND